MHTHTHTSNGAAAPNLTSNESSVLEPFVVEPFEVEAGRAKPGHGPAPASNLMFRRRGGGWRRWHERTTSAQTSGRPPPPPRTPGPLSPDTNPGVLCVTPASLQKHAQCLTHNARKRDRLSSTSKAHEGRTSSVDRNAVDPFGRPYRARFDVWTNLGQTMSMGRLSRASAPVAFHPNSPGMLNASPTS